MLRHIAEDIVKWAKVTLGPCLLLLPLLLLLKALYTYSSLQDGLERRGFKESGFLDEVAEVVKTGTNFMAKTISKHPICFFGANKLIKHQHHYTLVIKERLESLV